jgi:hypothetical protein
MDTTLVRDGSWHHAAATFESGTATFYLDGAPKGGKALALHTVGQVLSIGVKDTATDASPQEQELFHGEIDDVRVYGRALAAAEIASLYQMGGWPR